MARIAPHSTPPQPPHSPPTTTGLRMDGPVVPPRPYEPHSDVEPGPRTPMAIHHNAHLAPPRPRRNRNLLQHALTSENKQARAPLLSTPQLLRHTRTPDTNPHMPRTEPGHGLHPPLHLLLPQTRITRTRTHSHVPPRETHHLQGNRGVRQPHPTAQIPGGPSHHRPRHIRLAADEPMPRPTGITGGPSLLCRASPPSRPSPGGAPCN